MFKPGFFRTRRGLATGIAIGMFAAAFGFATFYPLPYFLKTPGTAEPVKPRVAVGENAAWTERGDFLFTTVYQHVKPGLLEYAFVRLTEKYTETVPVRKAIGNVSNVASYNQLTEWMRDDSEANSVIAAFRYLNRSVKIEESGVIIQQFLPDTQASKELHEGDIIDAVDGQPIRSAAELAEHVKSKKVGDPVTLGIKRGEDRLERTVPLIDLNGGKEPVRLGIGFYHAQVRKATPDVPIRFSLDDIGGPSAGLMLSLDIISKLEEKDYTRGRRIAGTGTIDVDGNVGQIGGIRYKLVAASRAGAEYFLVPKDKEATDGNQKEAEAFMREYRSDMRLVPVATLKEAADFLLTLSEKPVSSKEGE